MIRSCLLFALGVLVPGVTYAAELVAVVHPLNPSTDLSPKTVKKIYLGTVRFWDGGTVGVSAYLRPESSEAGKALMTLCDLSRQSYDAMWQKRQLAGQGIGPAELVSAAEVVKAVSEDPRAIGVITAEEQKALEGSTVRFVPIVEPPPK